MSIENILRPNGLALYGSSVNTSGPLILDGVNHHGLLMRTQVDPLLYSNLSYQTTDTSVAADPYTPTLAGRDVTFRYYDASPPVDGTPFHDVPALMRFERIGGNVTASLIKNGASLVVKPADSAAASAIYIDLGAIGYPAGFFRPTLETGNNFYNTTRGTLNAIVGVLSTIVQYRTVGPLTDPARPNQNAQLPNGGIIISPLAGADNDNPFVTPTFAAADQVVIPNFTITYTAGAI